MVARSLLRAVVGALAFGAAALVHEPRSFASDHIDGVKSSVDNAADLTDLYAFTSPQDSNKLVMIMNVHPLALGASRFSNAVDYKFRIRPIDDAKTLAPSNNPAREQSVVCSFSGGLPLLDARQRATCTFDFGATKEAIAFDTRGPGFRAGGVGQKGGLRVFAGVRSDSWFLDLAKTLKWNASLPVPNIPGVNGLWGQNVLSIVVEVDKGRLAGPLLAITAQTVRK